MVHLKCAFLSVESHEAKAKHRLSRASCQGSAVCPIVTPRPPRACISATCTLEGGGGRGRWARALTATSAPLCPCALRSLVWKPGPVVWAVWTNQNGGAVRGAVRPEETCRPHPGWISFFFQGGWDPRSRLCVWKWMICCLSRQWPVGACLAANWSHGVNGKHEEKAED